MQRAFGYDLSAILPHQDPRARAVGAVAFTRGTDLHFRPGAYDPTTDEGRRLLGHELAHVVQQAAGRVGASRQVGGVAINDDPALEREADAIADRALGGAHRGIVEADLAPLPQPRTGTAQRAIGMEFETTLPFVEKLGYHEVVYEPAKLGWKITDDGGKVEFVTRPLKTQDELIEAIQQIQTFVEHARKLLHGGKEVAISEIVQSAGLPHGGSAHVGGAKYKPEMLMAKPQVTVGIPMGRLAQLLADARRLPLSEYDEQLSKGESDEGAKGGHMLLYDETSTIWEKPARIDSLQVALTWGAKVARARTDLTQAGIDRMVGLMAYILRYLNDAYFKPLKKTPEYAKAYFPVMARTHFVAMYDSLAPEERALISTDAILNCWGVERAHTNVPMLRLGFQDSSLPGGKGQGPTIIDWLDSIVGARKQEINEKYRDQDRRFMNYYKDDKEFGEATRNAVSKDLLSRGDVGYNNVSMGLLGMDRSDGDEPLAVVEMRGFPDDTSLQPQYWSRLGKRLFDFYHAARTKPDSKSLFQEVQWSKDVVRTFVRNVRYQTNQLRDTTDDKFNAEMLKFQQETVDSARKLKPAEHEAITAAVRKFAEALAPLRERHDKLTRTAAHDVTFDSLVARFGSVTDPEDRAKAGEAFFKAALASLAVDQDATTQHNIEVERLSERIEKGPRDWTDNEVVEDFYQGCADDLARLEAIRSHYAKHNTFEGAPSDDDRQQRATALANALREGQPVAAAISSAFIGAEWKAPGDWPESLKLERDVEALRNAVDDAVRIADSHREKAAKATRRVESAQSEQEKEAARQEAKKATSDASATMNRLGTKFVKEYPALRLRFIELEPAYGRREKTLKKRPEGADKAVKEGGNCLFDSAVRGLDGTGFDATTLRLATSERVRLNPLDYVDRLVNEHDADDVMVEMDRAADFLAVPGNWDAAAGEIAPYALADVIADRGRQLVILNMNGSIRYSGPNGGVPVFIYYNNLNHYMPPNPVAVM